MSESRPRNVIMNAGSEALHESHFALRPTNRTPEDDPQPAADIRSAFDDLMHGDARWEGVTHRFGVALSQAERIADCDRLLNDFILSRDRIPRKAVTRVAQMYEARLSGLFDDDGLSPKAARLEGESEKPAAIAPPARRISRASVDAATFWVRSVLVFLAAALGMNIAIPYYLNRYVFGRMTFAPLATFPEPNVRSFVPVAEVLNGTAPDGIVKPTARSEVDYRTARPRGVELKGQAAGTRPAKTR